MEGLLRYIQPKKEKFKANQALKRLANSAIEDILNNNISWEIN